MSRRQASVVYRLRKQHCVEDFDVTWGCILPSSAVAAQDMRVSPRVASSRTHQKRKALIRETAKAMPESWHAPGRALWLRQSPCLSSSTHTSLSSDLFLSLFSFGDDDKTSGREKSLKQLSGPARPTLQKTQASGGVVCRKRHVSTNFGN